MLLHILLCLMHDVEHNNIVKTSQKEDDTQDIMHTLTIDFKIIAS